MKSLELTPEEKNAMMELANTKSELLEQAKKYETDGVFDITAEVTSEKPEVINALRKLKIQEFLKKRMDKIENLDKKGK